MRTMRTISLQYAYWLIVIVIVIVIVPTARSALVCVGVFSLRACVCVCGSTLSLVAYAISLFSNCTHLHVASLCFSFMHFVLLFVSRKLCFIFFPSTNYKMFFTTFFFFLFFYLSNAFWWTIPYVIATPQHSVVQSVRNDEASARHLIN